MHAAASALFHELNFERHAASVRDRANDHPAFNLQSTFNAIGNGRKYLKAHHLEDFCSSNGHRLTPDEALVLTSRYGSKGKISFEQYCVAVGRR